MRSFWGKIRNSTFKQRVVIALIVIALGCAAGIATNRHVLNKLDAETASRVDESCVQREHKWKSDVHSIKLTYEYIDGLSPSEVNSSLNQLIIQELPRTYKDAQFDKPLSTCAEPGVGLDENAPKLPPLKDYSKLLQPKK